MPSKAKMQREVPNKELILFLMSTFFFTNMQGMVGNYRQAYLINVLHLASTQVSIVNAVTTAVSFGLSFFYAMVIDRAPKPGKGKFIPYVKMSAVPVGVLTVLMFVSPQLPPSLLVAYLCTVAVLHAAALYFGNTVNSIGIVLCENQAERDKILTFRGIANAIANSAPLVVVLVIGLFGSVKWLSTEERRFVFAAVLCGAVGTLTMLLGVRAVRERVAYSSKKENPLLGFRDILTNPYAMLILLSDFIQNLRGVGGYMGIFLAAALLGDVSKYILFGLPTGIGTFVGMLLVNLLLKKWNSKTIFMLSGVYSLVANTGAFLAGLQSFRNPENGVWQIVFFAFLFLIGIQYGATNLLPMMFQADILEDLELKTHKRLEASMAFIISIGSTLGTVVTGIASPRVLYGEKSFIQYLPSVDTLVDGVMTTVYQTQSYDTKVRLLLVYTIFHGAMILLACAPFLFYRLTGVRKEEIHQKVLAYRESLEAAEKDEANI